MECIRAKHPYMLYKKEALLLLLEDNRVARLPPSVVKKTLADPFVTCQMFFR